MWSLVNWQNPYNPERHSYDYYYNKIKKDKDTYGNVLPGDVYEKIGTTTVRYGNIFKTLPGIQDAIYLIKKVTDKEGRWNKMRKRLGFEHGDIKIKYVRIKKNGNVPIYLDDKPLTANFYNWGQWTKDFKFVGKIWNVEGEPQEFYSMDYNIEFLEDIARRLAYEDKYNKEEWKLKRKEKEEKEARTKWLNSPEGRRWQENKPERKKYFDNHGGDISVRTGTPGTIYPKSMWGKLTEEEDKQWRKEAIEKERERQQRALQEHRERVEREREAREAEEQRYSDEVKARQKAEIERRRRDEARRQQLLRQAELWRRAEAVQEYLPGYWQDATEQQIEEAEREKENEERRVVRGGGNPNAGMLAIPKLKF